MFIENTIKKNYSSAHNPFNSFPVITLTLTEAIKEYLFWKASYATTAAIRYEDRLKPFMEYLGQDTIVSKIQTNDIIYFHQKMKEDGYSLKTIAYSCTILKNFFMFWLGRGVCTLNPVEIRPMKCISPDKKLISLGDFEQMSECLDERFFPELTRKLTIHLLWDCGMRLSELCDINISDIEETSKQGIRCAKIRRRKTQRYNIVVWSEETNRLLNFYLGVRLSLCIQSDALLIASKKYPERVSPRSVQRWIKEVAEIAMIDKDISPHCFRHSKAHRILDKSENIRDVQCVLGHSSPISSFHYLGLNKERQLSVSEKYL
jgi:integrase/recombinase XerD